MRWERGRKKCRDKGFRKSLLNIPRQSGTKGDFSFFLIFKKSPCSVFIPAAARGDHFSTLPSKPLVYGFQRGVGCLCFPGNPLHIIMGFSQTFARNYSKRDDFKLAVLRLGRKKAESKVASMPWSS